MAATEKVVQAHIVRYLQHAGFYAVIIQSGAVYQKTKGKDYMINMCPKGTPDILACIRGRFFGIEVKKDMKARSARNGITNRYKEIGSEPKSADREIMQYKTGLAICASGGNFLCTYSIENLVQQLADDYGIVLQ